MYLVRTYFEVEMLWSSVSEIQGYGFDECYSIIPNEDGSYNIIGTTTVRHTGDCYFLARTTPDPVTVPYLLDPTYPSDLVLHSPYPNPFNSTTTISWSLPRPERVTVTIFDQLGRRISTLLDLQQSPGSHSIGWQSDGLSAGVYICQVMAGGTSEVRELVMMR